MATDRRTFLKMQAAATAAAAAGISTSAEASNLVADSSITGLDWNKAPCRFCGTGCSVADAMPIATMVPRKPPNRPTPFARKKDVAARARQTPDPAGRLTPLEQPTEDAAHDAAPGGAFQLLDDRMGDRCAKGVLGSTGAARG